MRKRGFAIPALLFALVLALSALGLRAGRDLPTVAWRARRISADALDSARQALIAHAAWEDSSPGALLCPDFDNDGISDACGPQSPPGRLPWRTLGISPPRDGAGECLWYALSGGARSALKPSSRGANQPRLNPAYPGELSVVGEQGGAQTVIAVLIAPGRPLPGQQRREAGKPCRDGAPADFLDAVGGRDNARGPVFIAVGERPGFNDQLLALTADRLFDAAAPRVLLAFAGSGAEPGSGLRRLFALGYPARDFGPDPAGHPLFDFSSALAASAFPTPFPTTLVRGCPQVAAAGNFAIEWLCFNSWTSFIRYETRGSAGVRLSLTDWQLDVKPGALPHLARVSR